MDSSDDTSESSRSSMGVVERKSRPVFRNMVKNTMLPRNFEGLKRFFDPSEQAENAPSGTSGRPTLTPQSKKKEPSEALRAFREISYMKFRGDSSSEEGSCRSKDSHIDSEDSGLFKEGYVFERKSHPISRDTVNRKVKKWKEIASEMLLEVNKTYKPRRSTIKENFSVPLGLEANRQLSLEQPDDGSSLSQSKRSGTFNTDDELDMRRNDEFMREVRRVLRCKKNPKTLGKRSLPEEYRRLIFKKTAFVRDQPQKTLALTEKGESVTEHTDTGADGDHTSEPAAGIFEQLSEMVLKNKIVKNSKAAQKRNEVLRRVEERRGHTEKTANSDEENPRGQHDKETPKEAIVMRPGPSKALESRSDLEKSKFRNENPGTKEEGESEELLEISNLMDTRRSRIKKVESYLSSVSDVQSNQPELPEIRDMTSEREQTLFDSLAGEFLKNLATGNESRNKITKNDRRLLTIVVKRYIDRGEVSRVDELMNSNLNENILEVPPYENVSDREEFFLKKLIKKYLSRGMRDTLEDLIAWIYYKLESKTRLALPGTEKPSNADNELLKGEVRDMTKAFRNSGKNGSLDRVVKQLLREHRKKYPGLNDRQVQAVKETIKDAVIEKFARMYLERTKTEVEGNFEPFSLAVNVKENYEMNSGSDQIDVNGRKIEIKWKFDSVDGGIEPSTESNTEHETEGEYSDGEQPARRSAKPGVQEVQKQGNFVKERLEDIVWNIQQLHQRIKEGKANRTCSLVKKRSVTMIGDSNKRGKSALLDGREKEKKLDLEEKRKLMRKEHVKWLLEQKDMLHDARRKEAKKLETYTQALPKRLEKIIAKRNRSRKQLEQLSAALKNEPSKSRRNQ